MDHPVCWHVYLLCFLGKAKHNIAYLSIYTQLPMYSTFFAIFFENILFYINYE